MDKQNREDILAALERWSFKQSLPAEAYKKVRLMCSYCSKHDETEVSDPYYGGLQGFEKVLELIEDGCESLLESILNKNPNKTTYLYASTSFCSYQTNLSNVLNSV